MRRALVVIEDASLRQSLQLALHAAGFQTVGVASAREATRELATGAYELMVSRPGAGALALTPARELPRQTEAAPAGAATSTDGGLIGQHPRLLSMLAAMAKVAPHKTTVLVRGESGTGKELVARALHALSPRRDGPFVVMSCGAIPAGLLESELFGHERGAFTDAVRDRLGLFERASGGTLFLDEIGELPLAMQVNLLRVLQDDRVRRVGGSDDILVDVRVVAATARDLESEVAAGHIREDLYYRLDVLSLRLPPLRDRPDDVPLLTAHFIRRANRRLGLSIAGASAEALRALQAYRWPGNVRELENVVERAVVLAEGAEIGVELLPPRVAAPGASSGVSLMGASDAGDLSIKRTLRRTEEELIRRALARTNGNRTRAAELLEISHRALLYKIKEYKIGPAG
ncbi:MAG TPA: sigma-54 dependent transcriptional regulator [Polyangia bacterium]|jgi:two-component system response regulator AtoC|nr:sigma-54 dependent transcriptional regulator [Polyangia bacterium]